jgi:hypothetical protein
VHPKGWDIIGPIISQCPGEALLFDFMQRSILEKIGYIIASVVWV